jgi:Family of unknown function (DUF5701)
VHRTPTTEPTAAPGQDPAAEPSRAARTDRARELDRQVGALVDAGYPALAGLDDASFRRLCAPLHAALEALPAAADAADDHVPFTVVVGSALVPARLAVEAVVLPGGRGFTTMDDDDLARFVPIDGLDVPDDAVYLVADVDLGAASLDVPPERALPAILGAGRSPLTLAEGLSLAAAHPDVLERARYSMLGSRCGDRRVPALWVSRRRPRLGWCWQGAPHSWLGSASCGARVAG